jgi:hypothetical protein
MQAREALECYKNLMGDSCANSDENSDRNADSKNCAHGVSDGNEDSVGN